MKMSPKIILRSFYYHKQKNFYLSRYPKERSDTEPHKTSPLRIINRVSTGIPGYGLRTEMIRKFFPFTLWKRFRKTGIPERFPERFFFLKRKFPEQLVP